MGSVRIGAVMIETGHRFETSGRAFAAGRHELAAYEAEEILELFNSDMTNALLPGVCDDDIVDEQYYALVDGKLADLRSAAEASDEEAYLSAFTAVSASCNGCHAACEVGFIQVPAEPGDAVPNLDSIRPSAASAQ